MKIGINPPRKIQEKWDRRLALFAVLTIAAAWIVGAAINRQELPDCRTVLPTAIECRPTNGGYEGLIVEGDTETVVGWAQVAEAAGYAGPIQVLVGVDPTGNVIGIKVLHHTETPAFYDKVAANGFLDQFAGMAANAAFVLDQDLDGITRATFTTRAVSDAVREASYVIADAHTNLVVTREPEPIQFGVPEITLILLYTTGFFAHKGSFKFKKQVRWAMMLTGLIVLGFAYNQPLTVAHFNALLTGYWPDWHSNLYWFLLVGGVLLVVTVDKKNPYCQWFCPFGAAQECLGAIGGAKVVSPGKYRYLLKNMQRFLVWSAILMGVLLRNPGLSSYEVFGALFSFNGEGLQWVILIIVLLLSLFVRRPWCEFLCPIDPLVDLISAGRRWILEALRKWQRKTIPAKS
jgi:hypothetical protein